MNFQYWLDNFWSLSIGGLTQGAIYALVALGYTLVYGVLRLINFAHSEVFMTGTFAVPIVWGLLGFDQNAARPGTAGVLLLLLIGLVAASLTSATTALFVERIAYRPLRRKNPPSLVFLITAIGASIVILESVALLTDRKLVGAITLVQPEEVFSLFGAPVDNVQLIIIGSAIVMMFVLDQFINRTRLGRGVRAVAQNPDVSALMGVNRDRVIMLIFIIGGLMAGGAALLHIVKVGSTQYDVGFILGVKAFTAAVLGGIGNLRGALLGGLLLGLVENWGAGIFGLEWINVVPFVVLIMVLMFRPTGLLGEALGEGPGMIEKLANADSKRLDFLRNMGDRWRALPRLWRIAFWVALVALLFALPRLQIPVIDPLIRTTTIDFTTVLFTVSMYVIVAIGMNIVIGLAGLLDLGYIGFFAIGAYSVALFGSPESTLATRYPWLVCVPIAIALTMISGVLLGWPTLRVRGDYLAIVTLGFGEIVRLIAQNSEFTNGQRGISNIPHPPGTWPPGFNANWTGLPLFGSATALAWYWLTLACVIFCIAGSFRLERSRVGRAWLAIREDEDAAAMMGVHGFKYKLWAFAIGAALGGLAGALFAGKQQFMGSNSFDLLTSILFVAMVVIGGSGNTAGVILGAILVWYLPERLRGIDLFGVEIDVGEYRLLTFGIALIVIMTFRPQGLLPKRYRLSQPPVVEEEVEEAHEQLVSESAASESHRVADRETEASPGETLLKVDNVTLRFGGVTALDEVDFEVRKGEILGLIGPNGAGKTTCFNVMTGVFKPTSGRVTFEGEKITGRKEYEITHMGIARTFQNIRLFPQMTALENVLVGTDARHRTSVVGALFRLPRVRAEEHTLPENGYKRTLAKIFGISRHVAEERAARFKALELLDFVGVTAHADEQAKNLSYGEQRRLEIARALATEPKLLCLDEPAAGFNPVEKAKLLDLIRRIRGQGLTILLIEHDMRLVMGVTDRIVVLEFGKKIAEGSPAEVRTNPKVIAAYLGVPDDAA